VRSEWDSPFDDLFIPGAPHKANGASGTIPDAVFQAQPPRSLEAPPGSTTANFRREDGTLVINCHEQLVNSSYIAKALKWAKTEYGPANVKAVELWISDYTMVNDGFMLTRCGFERRIIANDKSGLHCWRRVFPQRKMKDKK